MLFENHSLCCHYFHVVGCAVILAILMVKGLELATHIHLQSELSGRLTTPDASVRLPAHNKTLNLKIFRRFQLSLVLTVTSSPAVGARL
jgi:hypothetical protein